MKPKTKEAAEICEHLERLLSRQVDEVTLPVFQRHFGQLGTESFADCVSPLFSCCAVCGRTWHVDDTESRVIAATERVGGLERTVFDDICLRLYVAVVATRGSRVAYGDVYQHAEELGLLGAAPRYQRIRSWATNMRADDESGIIEDNPVR
jgi:hypothetical protein